MTLDSACLGKGKKLKRRCCSLARFVAIIVDSVSESMSLYCCC